MTIDEAVAARITQLGIARVTHFTSSRNLPRILGDGEIMSTSRLEVRGSAFERTDPLRIDGRTDHICCNIEYPNFYYFNRASGRENAVNYSDWSLLLLDPLVAGREGTLFAPGNAAKNSGNDLRPGVDGLDRLYADSVYGRTRSALHWPSSPTDAQAEVLIPESIAVSDVTGIVVPDNGSLLRERGRLRHLGHDPDLFSWHVAPGAFRRDPVLSAIRQSADLLFSIPLSAEIREET